MRAKIWSGPDAGIAASSGCESTVLSVQFWVILRLINSTDQEHVSKFLPDSLSGLTRLLPSQRREANFVGGGSYSARVIRKLKRDELPDSHDIKFADGWAEPPIDLEMIQKVVQRWRREATGSKHPVVEKVVASKPTGSSTK